MLSQLKPPVALSVDQDDRRYRADWPDFGPFLRIAVNGEVQRDVITYDTVEGVVVRFMSRDGRLVLEGDQVVTETLHGEVTVSVDC